MPPIPFRRTHIAWTTKEYTDFNALIENRDTEQGENEGPVRTKRQRSIQRPERPYIKGVKTEYRESEHTT